MKKTTRRTNPKRPMYLNKVHQYIRFWVPILRLENFVFEVCEAPEGADYFAQFTGNVYTKRGVMSVRNPDLTDPDSLQCDDLEVTVVHELLHARFDEIIYTLEGKAHCANETATELTAMALVAMRRGVDPRSLYYSPKRL